MSWGIAETASVIEKIKSESVDYLNGLNSCGVIDWNTYNYAFDFYADLLMKAYKQGEKDAQLNPCEDEVSREAVLKIISDYNFKYPQYMERFVSELRDAMKEDLKDDVKDLPPVIPKRKTGKWIDRGYMKVGFYCSECGGYVVSGKENFCPNCGSFNGDARNE